MSGLAFVTHPSVRIKGSENAYTPVQCLDDVCSIKTPHLHCPFCVKSDSYTDPVILKAHYRVKHVDKGIEFAGLKILRCCDHCDIVGVIKGEKKFKGAHWHCYRCRNGFNRRDEAIKHYKTHFRNPQTTFQISITQDLNSPVAYSQDARCNSQPTVKVQSAQPTTTVISSSDVIHPALTQAISCISSPLTINEQDIISSSNSSLSNGKVHDGTLHVSIASSGQTVDVADDDQQAIVIIQEEQLESSEAESGFPTHIISNENIVNEKGEDKSYGLEERVERLEQEKAILKLEISQLHKHIERMEESLRASQKREDELLARLGNATEAGMAVLLKRLETEHRNLLRQQLDMLQQAVMTRSLKSAVLQLTDQHGQEIQVVSASSLEAFFAENTASATSDGQTTIPTSAIIHASDLPLEQVSVSDSSTVLAGEVPTSSTDAELNSKYVMCVQNLKSEKNENEDCTMEVTPQRLVIHNSQAEFPEPPNKKSKVQ